jgi:hypothetical protein
MMVVIFDDDEIFVGNHEVLAVDFSKDVCLEHVNRRARCIEAGFEKDQAIDPGADHIDVMGHEKDRQA